MKIPAKGITSICFYVFLTLLLSPKSFSQQTNNSSSLTNQAAPSASSVTTGGTNINYQTNNTYQNEFGFAPGVFCRTPTVFIGGNYGGNELEVTQVVGESTNKASNFQVNAGIVYPFGSRTIEACKQLTDSIVRDRQISTQLSMIKACADLEKNGINVDPEIFPLLEQCSVSVLIPQRSKKPSVQNNRPRPRARSLPERSVKPRQSLPPKIPQTTKS